MGIDLDHDFLPGAGPQHLLDIDFGAWTPRGWSTTGRSESLPAERRDIDKRIEAEDQ